MSKLPSFFKTKRHKSFTYKPLYYDADKEALNKRVEQIRKEVQRDSSTSGMKGNLRNEWQKNSRINHGQSSTIRIFVIAGILAIIFYLYLHS